MSPDGEQQLVLGGRQAGGLRLLLAPTEEAAQTGPQLEQVGEVRLLERHVQRRYPVGCRCVVQSVLVGVSIPSLKRRRTCFSGSPPPSTSCPSLKRPRCT